VQDSRVKQLYSLGCYESYEKFWDDLELAHGVSFEDTLQYKRVCLYPFFGPDVYLLPPFTVYYLFIKYILRGNVSGLEQIKAEIELRKERNELREKREAMNLRFINLFKEKIND